MKDNLRNMTIKQIIVHDLPKSFTKRYLAENPDSSSEGIILSDVPTVPDDEVIKFLQISLSSTIGSSYAFEVEFDPTLSVNKTQIAIKEYFQRCNSSYPIPELEVIRITQNIAKALNEVQTAKNPGGTLLFVPCNVKDIYGLAILKVEREDGVRIEKEITDEGKIKFNTQHVSDLLFTNKTRLFKISLFYQVDKQIIGFVCDKQQGSGQKDIADFFLVEFLGCRFKEKPEISTKNFFEHTISFINSSDLSDEGKLDMHNHLISELTSNPTGINRYVFAERALPKYKIQSYMTALDRAGVPLSFNKDIRLIQNKLNNIKYELTTGIKIMGTKEVLESNLKMSACPDGLIKFEIIDGITKVS